MDNINEIADLSESERAAVDKGLRARALLETQLFTDTVANLLDVLSTGIVTSEPHETKTRESLYFRIRGINDVVDMLVQDVQVCDDILKSREDKESWT